MHGCTGGGRGMTDAGRLTQPPYGFLETRRRRSALVAAGCVMLAALAFGQAPNDPLRYDDDLTEPAMPYVELDAPPLGPNRAGLRPGDLVYVDVYRRPELSTTTQVDASGNVTLPYVGVVHVAGKTDAEASLIAAQAFRRVLKSPQVTVSRTGAGMEGSFRTESMTTEIVVLENAKADQLAATLQGMNTEGGSVSFDSNTNSLIITDTPATLANILSVSERLDRMQSQLTQVRIEAKVAEVQTGAMKELGVRWFKQGAETNFGYYPLATQTPALNDLRAPQASPLTNEQVGGVSGNQGGSSAGGSGLGRRFVDEANFDRRLNIPAHIPRAGQLFFGLLNSHVDIGVMLDALVADNKAELLASPSILTVNHKTAEIRSTDEYPYTEFGTFVSGRNVFSTRFLDLGIKLTVTPHVGTDAYGRYVKIELEPEVS
ncbi:MAG: polysaccharide biosynthesis/export family protein, partial [Candidatus Hydrogenedentes bacterium]|nr:polysaccharide biosynthesis/export family protein [Candidatus Hydrogenedentota bacterium]